MNWTDIILKALAPAITVYIQLSAFGVLNQNQKIKLNVKNILIIVLCGMMVALNTYMNEALTRLVISFILLLVAATYIFKENVLKTTLYILVTYILMMFFEIFFSFIIISSNVISTDVFDEEIIVKSIFSILVTLSAYFSCHIKIFVKFSSKLANKFEKAKSERLFLLAILLVLMIIDIKCLDDFNIEAYVNNIILVACIALVIAFGVYNYSKANKEVEKTETLLNFLKRYEKIIDNDRENRHEILNNLLILKSIEDKNTEEYENILNDLITTYNKKGIGIKNVYNLPAGLKGIFYYRLNSLSNENMYINVNIAKKLSLSEKNMSHRDYVLLCRTIGIVLDNAIEAAKESKGKLINVDMYKEKKNYIICIDNSFDKKVDLNKIVEKNYSTKGKGRGLGLYLATTLLKNNELISMTQSIDNNLFMTKITIKQKTLK